jgi:hypothetical protein
MAKAPKDEFGTPFGQAGSAAATKLGTPFGQAGSAKAAQDANIAESDARLRARIPSSPNAAPKAAAEEKAAEDTTAKTPAGGSKPVLPQSGLTTEEVQNLLKSYTSDVLSKMSQEEKTAERLSAYNILRMEFEQYGLGSLVTDIRNLLVNDTPVSEFGLRLRGTDAYKERFKANEARIAAGLAALSPAEYVALEDQYQNVMRNYGLPASYYTKDQTGKQVGFEKFIAGDVSATELEDRISTAQKRVINANPEVSAALKAFYPDITNGDILAYALDPSQGLEAIKRKVTAAEIGGAAMGQNLTTSAARAMQLAGYGVTKEQAQQGFQTVAEIAPRGSQLADIYGEAPYGQAEAEAEVFNTQGSAQAAARRKKLKSLEEASFGGSSGVGALGRDKAIYGGAQGQSGLY